MSDHPTPAEVAVSFTEAWTSHDLQRAATYLADDVVYDGPVNHIDGAGPYMEALTRFALAVTEMRLIAVLGDAGQALIMYEVSTSPFGTLTCGEHLTVASGKITADRVAFDTFAIRTRATASAAS